MIDLCFEDLYFSLDGAENRYRSSHTHVILHGFYAIFVNTLSTGWLPCEQGKAIHHL